jgi:GTP1/Obg family GTP-binding protein
VKETGLKRITLLAFLDYLLPYICTCLLAAHERKETKQQQQLQSECTVMREMESLFNFYELCYYYDDLERENNSLSRLSLTSSATEKEQEMYHVHIRTSDAKSTLSRIYSTIYFQ